MANRQGPVEMAGVPGTTATNPSTVTIETGGGPVVNGLREGRKWFDSASSLSPTQVITTLFVILCLCLCFVTGFALNEIRDVMIRNEKRSDEREAEGYRWQASEAEKNRKAAAEERAKDRKVIEDNTTTMKKVETALIALERAVTKKAGVMD